MIGDIHYCPGCTHKWLMHLEETCPHFRQDSIMYREEQIPCPEGSPDNAVCLTVRAYPIKGPQC